MTKNTYERLQEVDLHFIGNVEARDLLNGAADVVVTDGFTGNMVLKSIEGTAMSVMKMLKSALMSSVKTKIAAAVLKPDLLKIKAQMDYSEYGGAGLFGLKAPVVKAHGSSDANAIFNAIRQAHDMVQHQVSDTIRQAVEKDKGVSE